MPDLAIDSSRPTHAARRLGGVALGWAVSLPVVVGWCWTAWMASQDGARTALKVALALFVLHLVGMLLQTLWRVRGVPSPRLPWLGSIVVMAAFALLAMADAGTRALLGPYAWPHWTFAAILMVLNRPGARSI